MRNKKTAIISGIVILEICFLYFGEESLAGLGGSFHAIFDHRLSREETLSRDEYCLWKTQKILATFPKGKLSI